METGRRDVARQALEVQRSQSRAWPRRWITPLMLEQPPVSCHAGFHQQLLTREITGRAVPRAAPEAGRAGPYGLRIVRAERWLDAMLPDADPRELLQIGAQEPLLRIESIASGPNGRALEHCCAPHRCQSSRLHVKSTT